VRVVEHRCTQISIRLNILRFNLCYIVLFHFKY